VQSILWGWAIMSSIMGATILTAEMELQIIDEVSLGERSLRAICREIGISHTSFLDHVRENQQLADQYTRAKEIGDDLAFDHLRELQTMEPERGKFGVDPGWVAWKRQQVDTLKWELSKRHPRKYGERVAVEHSGEIDLAGRLAAAEKRIGPKE
jgi:hypothetical protein